MTEKIAGSDRRTLWIRRIARIWSAPVILYALIMAGGYTWSWVTTGVADPYAVEEVSTMEALPPILLFISVLGLAVAWRWERFGAGIALLFQGVTLVVLILQSPITDSFLRSSIPFILVLIAVIPGILFLIHWSQSRQLPASSPGL